jgi:hypothetical protein
MKQKTAVIRNMIYIHATRYRSTIRCYGNAKLSNFRAFPSRIQNIVIQREVHIVCTSDSEEPATSIFRNVTSLFPVAPTLEHRASVKRFVSLQFLNPRTVDRIPWAGDQPVARPLPNTNTE